MHPIGTNNPALDSKYDMSDYDEDGKGPCCRCACGFAFLLVFLGVAASAFAFATTWWVETMPIAAAPHHMGLWQKCSSMEPQHALNQLPQTQTTCEVIYAQGSPPNTAAARTMGPIKNDFVMYVRYVQMATMALMCFLLMLYVFGCCCSIRGKKCLLAMQEMAISLAAAGQVASVVLFALKIVETSDAYTYSWSFYLAGIGAGFTVLAMFAMLVDACMFSRRS